MPKDATPRQSQALQPEDLAQAGSLSASPKSATPTQAAASNSTRAKPEADAEQVFAGECGDPIWEGRRPAAVRGGQRVPRTVTEERVPAGRIIDLDRPPAAPASPAGA